MNEDKRKALESAGWKFGSADEFLGERPMSNDKMRAEFEAWVSDNWRKLEAYFAFWDNEFCYTKDSEAAFLIYAAGRKAEREAITKDYEEFTKRVLNGEPLPDDDWE